MKLRSLLCFLLAALFLLASCGGAKDPTPDAAQTTAEPSVGEQTTEEPTETETELPEPDKEPGVVKTLDLSWTRGYVASSTNTNATATLMDGGSLYSYTNVFTVPYAGTKITFTDTAASGSGGVGYASDNAYVFSFWKQNATGEWVLDGSMRQYPGVAYTDSAYSKITADHELTYTYVTGKDQENIRICYHSGERKGDTNVPYPTVTMVYTGETSTEDAYIELQRAAYADLFAWLDSTKNSAWFPQLEGKTINVIGDSYFAGNGLDKTYVWPSLLSLKYNMKLTNHGINGSTVCVTPDNKNPMVKRYQKLPDNDPDIVIVEGGRNDRSQNSAGKGAAIGENNTTDETTFKGALTSVLRGLRQKYPNAMIMCVTAWRVDDGTTAYGTAMKEVCAYEGVPCFDATNQEFCKVYMTSANFRAEFCMSANDVSHLNLEGMKRVMPIFEKFIAEEYAKFLKA